jgi:hypothetical protein
VSYIDRIAETKPAPGTNIATSFGIAFSKARSTTKSVMPPITMSRRLARCSLILSQAAAGPWRTKVTTMSNPVSIAFTAGAPTALTSGLHRVPGCCQRHEIWGCLVRLGLVSLAWGGVAPDNGYTSDLRFCFRAYQVYYTRRFFPCNSAKVIEWEVSKCRLLVGSHSCLALIFQLNINSAAGIPLNIKSKQGPLLFSIASSWRLPYP